LRVRRGQQEDPLRRRPGHRRHRQAEAIPHRGDVRRPRGLPGRGHRPSPSSPESPRRLRCIPRPPQRGHPADQTATST
jgi:hypothetical protein